MIRRIQALNYRCLRYVDVPLDRYHLLVGPNASGKSTLCDAIAFLSELVRDGLEAAVANRSANFADLVWGRPQQDGSFELAVEFDVPEDLRVLMPPGTDFETFRYQVAVGDDASDQDLAAMHARGARGVRLNTDNAGGMPIDWDELPGLCRRIAPMGWHVEFLFPGRDMVELAPLVASLPVPACIGHFAYQPAADGVEAAGFQALLALLRDGNTWLKISGADRVSAAGGPGYDDVAPLAEAAIEANPERIMWGTDWPHPNKYDAASVPDEGDLVDTLGSWVGDPDLLRSILVDNPEQFYGF